MYRLIRFGSTNLEYYNQVDNVGSGPTPSSYQGLPDGGALDNYGSAVKNPGVVERVKTLRLQAATVAALESLYFGLLALRGSRDKLFRRTSQGDYHWVYARLAEVNAARDYQITRFKLIQDLELRFLCQDAYWRGAYRGSWTFDSGIYFDAGYDFDTGETHPLTASPCSFAIALGSAFDAGRAAVRALIITVTAGSVAMSDITIARTSGETLVYTGTIPIGGQLVINTATMQVSCTGVTDAYNNLTFTPIADMAAWFSLQPGSNPITVTYTGGGTGKAIDFLFNEAWV